MKYLTFTDNFGYGITINYPLDWEKKEAIMDAVVVFLSPLENESDKFRENFSIIIKEYLKEQKLSEEYIEFELEQLKETLIDFQLIKKTKIKISNISAYKIVYTGKKQEIDIQIMQYYALKNNGIYLLTYTAERDKFNKFLKVIKKMIKSFKIT